MTENKSKMTEQIRSELKELTTSINSMMEAFRSIRQPIQESSAKLPTTASQLEKVTEQTEQATHKVLDMIESITNRESDIGNGINKVKDLIPQESLDSVDGLSDLLDELSNNVEANLNDSYNIMDALQFQDITTQQIDHAISLLDEVEVKLHSMLTAVGIKDVGALRKNNGKQRAFDPNANFNNDSPTQQKEIDKLISGLK
jgi:chemotaxis regulatin CheY-phosphate phosphatase CheZ